jgi:hypothetical protein
MCQDNVLVELVEGDDTSDVPTMSYNFVKIADLAAAEKERFSVLVDLTGLLFCVELVHASQCCGSGSDRTRNFQQDPYTDP